MKSDLNFDISHLLLRTDFTWRRARWQGLFFLLQSGRGRCMVVSGCAGRVRRGDARAVAGLIIQGIRYDALKFISPALVGELLADVQGATLKAKGITE
jgi:hypothetical protein